MIFLPLIFNADFSQIHISLDGILQNIVVYRHYVWPIVAVHVPTLHTNIYEHAIDFTYINILQEQQTQAGINIFL